MRSYFIGRFRLPPGLEKHLMKLNIYKKLHNITCIDFKYFSRIKKKSFKSKSNKKKKWKKYAVSIHRDFKCPKNITKLRKFDVCFQLSIQQKRKK